MTRTVKVTTGIAKRPGSIRTPYIPKEIKNRRSDGSSPAVREIVSPEEMQAIRELMKLAVDCAQDKILEEGKKLFLKNKSKRVIPLEQRQAAGQSLNRATALLYEAYTKTHSCVAIKRSDIEIIANAVNSHQGWVYGFDATHYNELVELKVIK